MSDRVINVRLLADKSGRACIHWLMPDEAGPIATVGVTKMTALGPLRLGGIRGRIACNPEQNSVNPMLRGGETLMCMHSDDVRAATCPKCLGTVEAIAMLERLNAMPPVQMAEDVGGLAAAMAATAK